MTLRSHNYKIDETAFIEQPHNLLNDKTNMNPKALQIHAQRGSASQALVGFIMMCAGFYLLMQSIVVTNSFFLGVGLFQFGGAGGMSITGGMILVPLIFGIGMIFYKSSNIIGWALATGSLAALIVGVIVNIHFSLRSMSLFELLGIFVLAVGGLGLFLRGLSEGRKVAQ